MSRKWSLISILLILTAGLSIFAVQHLKPQQKEVVISVGDWPGENGPRHQIYERYARMIKEQRWITVVPDEWSYSINSFLPKAAAGKLPTLYNTWFTETGKIIEAGYAAEITPQLAKRGWDRALSPETSRVVKRNGKIYGVPRDAYLMGLMCNLKLFRKAGLLDSAGLPQIPRTYAELARTAKLIKDRTGAAGFLIETSSNGGGWHFMNIAWSFGAEFERKVNGRWQAVFNSPQAVAALEYIRDLRWKYDLLPNLALIDWAKGQELIGTGQCAMKLEAGFEHNGFDNVIDNYHMNKDLISMGSVPAGSAGRMALLGGNIYMFAPNASTEQINAALEWIKLLGQSPDVSGAGLKDLELAYRNDYQAGYVVGNPGIPVWVNPGFTRANQRIRSRYSNVNPDNFRDYRDFTQVKIHSEEPVNCQELYSLLDRVIQTVLTDKNANPQALLNQAVREFQKAYLDKANRSILNQPQS